MNQFQNTRKKVIPFECTFCPVKELDIKGQGGKIIKTLYLGNLVFKSHKVLIKEYFKKAINIIDENNKPTGESVVNDVYFDSTDNSLALYVDNQMTILDYVKIKKEIDKENPN